MSFERPNRAPASAARARSLRRRMTWSEQQLWKALRKLDANFRRQAPIGRYFADFATHGARVVIEVDGRVHERLDDVALRDFERQAWLEAQGYRVIRFTNRQVDDHLDDCLLQIEALLLDRGAIADVRERRKWPPAPTGAATNDALRTPPSPTLPPSRRKGA